MYKEKKLIYSLFEKIIPQRVRDIYLGLESNIFIDFGMDLVTKSSFARRKTYNVRSEWHFWIYMAGWQLERKSQILGESYTDRNEMQRVIEKLKGKKLLKVVVTSDEYDMVLIFEDNFELYVMADNTEENNEQWMLFTSDIMVLTAGPFEKLTYKHETDPIDDD